ncbi:MAG TPA: hypothetical protein DEA78_13120 [Cyanobacteria bacterium UBA11159]|nr:hypothetical protein [Cyanobacteria bacterium UBA11166]HBR74622.1 hypothetical protein [Cyanobacteria bacterium UBA11159]HBS68334.1 hypothetical protein [Cyanobacteria bacterium UBA11153]HCA97497.1 hypothetical protein [Cyanobacteria bacterium UBA9226]
MNWLNPFKVIPRRINDGKYTFIIFEHFLYYSQYPFFPDLFFFSQQDTTLSDKDKFSDFAPVVLMTIFWPIVFPLGYLELLEKKMTCKR